MILIKKICYPRDGCVRGYQRPGTEGEGRTEGLELVTWVRRVEVMTKFSTRRDVAKDSLEREGC